MAARFGRATSLHAGWHPHGHWGATGAAAAAALVLGAEPRQVAAAIDCATGLMQVTPWDTVLAATSPATCGSPAQARPGCAPHGWHSPDSSTTSGTPSTRWAAWPATSTPTARRRSGLTSWLVTEGYLKRHAACSYTHAAVDLVASLRAAALARGEIAGVHVRTHSLARPLLAVTRATVWPRCSRCRSWSRTPWSAASRPRRPCSREPRRSPQRSFSAAVHVEFAPDWTPTCPTRGAPRSPRARRRHRLALAQPNPIGDADHFPLDEPALRLKLQELIGPSSTARLDALIADLETSHDAANTLVGLGTIPPAFC